MSVSNSILYSTNLIIEIYKSAAMTDILTLVGICDPITDPLLDGESNCQNFAGDVVKITRTCPTPPCQLGLCGAGVFSNCDCSKTQIGSDYFDKSIT
jgi:hypothetical protein